MTRLGLAIVAISIALAPALARAETDSNAARLTKVAATTGKTTTVKALKRKAIDAGPMPLPIEVSPFLKPQLSLSLPRL